MKRLILALAIVAASVVGNTSVAQSAGNSTNVVPGTHICTDPTTVTSRPSGGANYGGASAVSQDVWNDINIDQTLYSCGMNSWYVTAKAAKAADGGAVQSYPDSNVTMPAKKISSFTSLTQNFRITDPPSCTGNVYESADDIWLGGSVKWVASTHTEMMIWSYNCNQVPAGPPVGPATIDGVNYIVYESGCVGSGCQGDFIIYYPTVQEESQQYNLLDYFRYAAHHGWLEAGMNTYLWQVDSGFEICYTKGLQKFQETAFSLRGNNEPIPG
jgi:hypothetical protein